MRLHSISKNDKQLTFSHSEKKKKKKKRKMSGCWLQILEDENKTGSNDYKTFTHEGNFCSFQLFPFEIVAWDKDQVIPNPFGLVLEIWECAPP